MGTWVSGKEMYTFIERMKHSVKKLNMGEKNKTFDILYWGKEHDDCLLLVKIDSRVVCRRENASSAHFSYMYRMLLIVKGMRGVVLGHKSRDYSDI